jgi:hypothetical protein
MPPLSSSVDTELVSSSLARCRSYLPRQVAQAKLLEVVPKARASGEAEGACRFGDAPVRALERQSDDLARLADLGEMSGQAVAVMVPTRHADSVSSSAVGVISAAS